MAESNFPVRRIQSREKFLAGFLWTVVLSLCVLWGCGQKPETDPWLAVTPEDRKPIILEPQKIPEIIADFEFTDRSGRKVTRADLLGRPWLVCFVFTRCTGPCLGITGEMKRLQDRFQDTELRFVTITVDPDYDTPKELKKYAAQFEADSQRWLFLTGNKKEIYDLIRDSFQMSVQEATGAARIPGYEVAHSTNILHVNAEGHVIGRYNAQVDTEIVALRRALEGMSASGKKQDGRTGSQNVEVKEDAGGPVAALKPHSGDRDEGEPTPEPEGE